MEVNELTKLFREKAMELISQGEFSIKTDNPADAPRWKEFDFKLGVTREDMDRYDVETIIKILSQSLIRSVYVLHDYPYPTFLKGISFPIYDIYIEEDPKIENDFETDIYKATCKFKSRLTDLSIEDMAAAAMVC